MLFISTDSHHLFENLPACNLDCSWSRFTGINPGEAIYSYGKAFYLSAGEQWT